MKFLLNYLNAEMDLEANLEMKPQVMQVIWRLNPLHFKVTI